MANHVLMFETDSGVSADRFGFSSRFGETDHPESRRARVIARTRWLGRWVPDIDRAAAAPSAPIVDVDGLFPDYHTPAERGQDRSARQSTSAADRGHGYVVANS